MRLKALQNKIPQVLLFIGPTGIGKGALARQFAEECLGEALDNHPDFFCLKPEGKTAQYSAEAVRDLILMSQMPPYKAKKRFIMIEEAERLGTINSNALLKTLEEPFEHTTFLLLATSRHKLLPTLLSRSLQIPVQPPSPKQIEEKLHSLNPNLAKKASELSLGSLSLATEIIQDEGLLKLFEQTIQVIRVRHHFDQLVEEIALLSDLLEERKKKKKTLSLEEKESYSLHSQEKLLKELEGEAALEQLSERKQILNLILAWFRDLHLLQTGTADLLIFESYKELLTEDAGGFLPTLESVEDHLRQVEIASERFIPFGSLLESLFLELQKPPEPHFLT